MSEKNIEISRRDEGTITPIIVGSAVIPRVDLKYRREGNTIIFDVEITRDDYIKWVGGLPMEENNK